ncbi:DUF305 domain-containing protein [Polyangium aurulentum]|uniref:DUF305 domain-containing protein n=1 Tax=Polyangium aurulentum TaxID=2567896 RepID=UPI0010AEB0B1|nr:DUF305 domain-containing protein [Polyangium aurulentum]UQA63173.1 DUF305 domain-containing protein [Polyangium aurulentum]
MTTHRAARGLTLRMKQALASASAIAVVVALPVAFAGCSEKEDAPAAARPPGESAGPYEVQFMRSMIEHHRGAVMMAGLCLDRAEHAALRDLCGEIITAQEREIASMQGWLEAWYGMEPEEPDEHATTPHAHGMAELSSLQGRQFEAAFLEEMIGHHATAVEDASECQRVAVHPEMLSLCGNIGTSQRQEIARMESWQGQWFRAGETRR